MRPGLLAFLTLVVLPLAACGSATEKEWAGPPRAGDGGRLPVGTFNDYLVKYGEHARSPVVAATAFLRLDRTTAATTSIVAHATEEGSGPTTVVVTLDRLPDDSLRAQRYVLVFSKDDGGWRLVSAVTEQRCWANRGHETFSTKPCV